MAYLPSLALLAWRQTVFSQASASSPSSPNTSHVVEKTESMVEGCLCKCASQLEKRSGANLCYLAPTSVQLDTGLEDLVDVW